MTNGEHSNISGKKILPTAAEYIGAKDVVKGNPSNLVMMFDGIENTGWKTHDQTVKQWTDLVSGIAYDVGNSPQFDDNSLTNNRKNCQSSVITTVPKLSTYTIETVTSLDGYPLAYDNMIVRFNNTHLKFPGVYATGRTTIYANAISSPVISDSYGKFNLSYVCDKDNSKAIFYSNSNKLYTQTATNLFALNGQLGFIGSNAHWEPVFGPTGDVHVYCIRVYDRVLTDQEIAYNYQIDKERFGV